MPTQIKIGRHVVDGPIDTIAVCIRMGEQNKREKYRREPATYVRAGE